MLVFHLRPRFELIRRVHLSGGPYAIAYDKEDWGLWIELDGAPARARRGRYPARPVPIDPNAAGDVDSGEVDVVAPENVQVLRPTR